MHHSNMHLRLRIDFANILSVKRISLPDSIPDDVTWETNFPNYFKFLE